MKRTIAFFLMISCVAMILSFSVAADNTKQFADVDPSKWYVPYIDYVVQNGYMNGVSETRFAPEAQITRAQYVQVLYALDGKPSTPDATPFTDLKKSAYYIDAVSWAFNTGVTGGISKNKFGPDQIVTREQAVTFYKAYAEKVAKKDAGESAELSAFIDSARVAGYAQKPMQWAVGAKIVSGSKSGNNKILDPKGTLTRAQMATMLKAFNTYLASDGDKEGNIIYLPTKEILTDAEGSYVEYIRTFDEKGNNISLEQRFYPNNYNPASGGTFDYRYMQTRTMDSSGKILSETWTGGGELGSSETSYFYNDSGILEKTERKHVVPGGEKIYTTEYSFDEQKNLIEEKDVDNHIQTKFSYDVDGNIVSRVVVNDQGSRDSYYYEYDQYGNPTKITNTNGSFQSVSKFEYTYDLEGRILSILQLGEHEGTESITSKTTYEYDSNGNLKKTITQSGNAVNTHTYEYQAIAINKTNQNRQPLIQPILYAG